MSSSDFATKPHPRENVTIAASFDTAVSHPAYSAMETFFRDSIEIPDVTGQLMGGRFTLGEKLYSTSKSVLYSLGMRI